MKWQAPHTQSWENMYKLLVQYKEREGNCTVTVRNKEDGKNVGAWMQNQRRKNKIGTLSIEHLHKLEENGVVF